MGEETETVVIARRALSTYVFPAGDFDVTVLCYSELKGGQESRRGV